jgi:hypothetical protein
MPFLEIVVIGLFEALAYDKSARGGVVVAKEECGKVARRRSWRRVDGKSILELGVLTHEVR